MVKIGDKVRFLNSVGGGTVKAFQGKNMVLVEDESGFDFPVATGECVVIGSSDASLRNGSPAVDRSVMSTKAGISEVKPADEQAFAITETPEGERLNVWLAYLPVNPKALTQSEYECYFINDSNYYLYFNYMFKQNTSYTSRFHGLVEPNTKVFVEAFPRNDLNDMERVCVQFIALKKDKPFTLKNTFSVDLRIDTVKFFKLHCYTENDYFDEPALLVPVVQSDVPEKTLLVSAAEVRESMMLHKKQNDAQRPKPAAVQQKTSEPQIIEVDLHIGQLLDTTQGLTSADILNYQLNVFRETLKRYAGKRGQQIVFIHGKGEGVLRTAIEKELKTHYKAYTFQDASFQEYGFGATLVKIR